jgi:hypothetical protein
MGARLAIPLCGRQCLKRATQVAGESANPVWPNQDETVWTPAEVRDHLRRYVGSDLISIEQDRKYSEEALCDSEESATRKPPNWLVRNVIYVPFPQRESVEWNDQGQA